ncbi:MAG: DUF6108 family protein [Candidatus Saccharimonadaceae bacterium]
MKKIKETSSYGKCIALLVLCMIASTTFAQKQLEINKVFEKYGKLKGSTMVVLSDDVIKSYHLDFYKSITLPYDKQRSEEIQQSLEIDKKQAKKIKEVISNGIIYSGYYQLPTEDKLKNRYILFKISDNTTATLIYMEGDIESEEIVNMLFIKDKK